MPDKLGKSGAELFIVDNSDNEWKVRDYLREWTEIANKFDIATGYFEIGSLLTLEGMWQKLDKIRILMGDEITKRTKKALIAGIESIEQTLDASIENEKEKNDFLSGVPAIVEALQKQQIECRIFNKKKFHAKAYITHSKLAVVGSSALVGSSNFTYPGLTDNIELNVQLRREVELLQEWYERHWNEAVDITPEILKIIERHTREYLPFEIYAKALHEYFRGHEMTVGEWELANSENGGSQIYNLLDGYQQEGYQALMKKGDKYNGAFLCDGVGLGKTFIGMMLIERLIERDRKRVALFVPKSARKPVWEKTLDRYLPNIHGDFSNLVIFNHTDLNSERQAGRLERIKEMADVIIIDEAHHFRNPGIKGEGERLPSRYRKLFDICEGKTVFMLTATPINNKLSDLQHMIELFSRRHLDYFKDAPLGIHSLPGHFRKMEKALESLINTTLQFTLEDVAPDVAKALKDQSEMVRISAAPFFKNHIAAYERFCGPVFFDENWHLQHGTLGLYQSKMRIFETTIIPAMVEALKDELGYVRECAAETLGLMGPRAAVAIPSLVKALQDRKPDVRTKAAEALRLIDPQALD